ncbi:hypothetical protein FRX31_008099 [Thalictrum thalictroides]|uniref:F-box/kelch-repeat protein n=1 Tax=Thalictrum thalictroides TaxID=46969 RepID=A0A7J6WZ07_THATH|nr:hypothetical protein FRX31_008099 [Thalictrum thalictroides]
MEEGKSILKRRCRRAKVLYFTHFKIVRKYVSSKKKNMKKKKKKVPCAFVSLFKEEEEGTNHHQVSIYFCAQSNCYSEPFKWYRINPHEKTRGTGTEPILSPICSMPSPFKDNSIIPECHSVVGVDSKLYVIGGFIPNEPPIWGEDNRVPMAKTYVCDINSDPNNWKECCSMNFPKISPTLKVADGLIYAFGGTDADEVFDPSLNKWTILPSPPDGQDTSDFDKCGFLKDRDEIMMLNSDHKTLFLDNIPTITRYGETNNSVAVGNFVFTFRSGELYACDISQAKPIEEPVYGLWKAIPEWEDDLSDILWQLYYIGKGKFCLMWDTTDGDMLLITCVKFWVGKYNEKGSLNALIDRTDYYFVKGLLVTSGLAM